MNNGSPQLRERTPWLMVRGNAIVRGRWSTPEPGTAEGEAVVLRGINLSGLQHRQFLWAESLRWRDAAGLTTPVIRKICTGWNVNLVRLPVNRDWYLDGLAAAGKGSPATRRMYRSDIREIVCELATYGVYTLLNPHSQTFAADDPRAYTPPMPDEKLLAFWEAAAREFRNDPAVLFDLFNEPHRPLPPPLEPPFTDDIPGGVGAWISAWHEWTRKMEAVIHALHPDALLFVSGIGGPCWGASLRSMPIPIPPYTADRTGQQYLPNAVYAAHVYRYPAARTPDPLGGGLLAPGTTGIRGFHYWFGFAGLRKHHPVFVSEWGSCLDPGCRHPDCAHRRGKTWRVARKRWLLRLESYLRKLSAYDRKGKWQGLAGWTAWSWGDHPHLVLKDERGEDRLTEFGRVVKKSLDRMA